MLPKQHRLPAFAIGNVLRSKDRVSSREFQIVFVKNNLSVSRFAVIVPNSIDKRATVRNRIKRTIRESVRHLLPRMNPGIDSVVLVRSNISEKKQSEVEQSLIKLLVPGDFVK